MSQSVFEHIDYKAFLVARGAALPRGFRKALAQATNCQTAYISQVLNGSNQLSLEQAEAVARFLEFGKNETRYFILLVEHHRAGTPTLKRYFEEQLAEVREKHFVLKERLGVSTVLSESDQMVYYASWHYSVVHMAVTIPRLRTRSALGRALRIPPRKLGEVLDFLSSVGLVSQEGERYVPGTTELHLPKNSPWIRRHHTNGRELALSRLDSDHEPEALHYTSISSLSAEDAQKIKAMLTDAISQAVRVVKDSPEEQLYGINIDLFRADE